ncbi:hypothetical protein VIGAN_03041200 [Vigna angularis var. angularis]|uniref:Uncharacterized protein n=1 Tax=Vigna angularis var. angularis TaxID=157739 RepID=A0A0S3RJK2_PHAAN|nr:hypothetical protein VIGAN_03041200 [Vigna angularis var. angularis]
MFLIFSSPKFPASLLRLHLCSDFLFLFVELFGLVFRCLGTKIWCVCGLSEADRQGVVRWRSGCLQSRGSGMCSLPHRASRDKIKHLKPLPRAWLRLKRRNCGNSGTS